MRVDRQPWERTPKPKPDYPTLPPALPPTRPEFIERAMIGRMSLEDQAYLDKYLPGYAPVIAEMMVDESIIHMAARDLGAHPFEIATALNFIMLEEIEVLYNRYKEKMQALHNSTEKSQAMQ